LFFSVKERIKIVMSGSLFSSIELSQEILNAIEDMNYTEMTDIQEAAIPLILEGNDVIGRSSTGTGKTAAFGIPVVETIDPLSKTPQVLILSPTRELAMQISDEIKKYSKYKPYVNVATVYGGQSIEIQFKQLKKANIIVGTPGRIMDHMRRSTIKLDDIKTVILDEADEMLNMGFYEDIQTILMEAPEERQTLLFSATMPPAIMNITKEFQKNPIVVTGDKQQRSLDSITQYYYHVPQGQKLDALNLLLQIYENKRSLVFCNTKKMVDEIVETLNKQGFKTVGLHGDMNQAVRTSVMDGFKGGRTEILVATDVAARGIDVQDIEAVFNYDLPNDFEYYIHRIGRTGRAGKTGISHTIISNNSELRRIREISHHIRVKIKPNTLPNGEDIIKKNHEKLIGRVKFTLDEKLYRNYDNYIQELIEEGYSEKDITFSLMTLLDNYDRKFIPTVKVIVPQKKVDQYKNIPDNAKVSLRVNIGRNQGIAPKFIVGAIVQGTDLPAKSIGKIEIYPDYSEIKMSKKDAVLVIDLLDDSKIKGRNVKFSLSKVSLKESEQSHNKNGKKQTFNKESHKNRTKERNDFSDGKNDRKNKRSKDSKPRHFSKNNGKSKATM